MASKIEIANMALTHLGMKTIRSLESNDPAAIACSTFFDAARDEVLGEAQWPFANVQALLTLTSQEIVGWRYAYLYPVKAASVWAVYDEGTTEQKDSQDFEVKFVPGATQLRVVCSNLANAYCDYTYKVEDTSLYSPKFVAALSYRLAAAMAQTLIGSAELGIQAMNIYNALISEAKRISAAEKKKKPTQRSSYQDSRGS